LADAAGAHHLGRASKDVRRITRALGPIRELDVALGHLQEMGPLSGVPARSLAHVRRHLATERPARRKTMLDVITPRAASRIKTHLEPGHTPTPPGTGNAAEIHSARQRVARRAIRLRMAINRAGGLYNSERLHAVRVAAKKLRYAMEVDRDLTRSRAMARINRFKNLQDALGQIHDYEILLEHTREVQIALAGVDRRAAIELDGLVRTLETACRDGHAVFLRDRAGIQALCQQIVEAARQGRPTFL
jgi:CHAD domain-containing protein